ncbi:unnamed protein product [Danaus chrysippus]|uniref:(African queen) hypothetical protein n=1 Tax=Danaus chrysippus TaxID=151541 RepID=A0A8J2R013_9NEOP|nr:unnamed protein product [Danaus chrysippus]
MRKIFKLADKEIIFGHKICQTHEAKYLCIEELYQKFYRPNCYDIGGTYINDVPDFWFIYKTEIIGKLFLFHLYVTKRQACSFIVSVSCTSDIICAPKQNAAFLPSKLENFPFNGLNTQGYVTTYSFTEVDVDILKGKKLYIPVSFSMDKPLSELAETMKENHNYKYLLHDPVGSDFVIESADGYKFNVHRSLLCANSEVFRAMLKDETAESMNGYVKMVDINKDDLKDIIEFMYTGTIENLLDCNFYNIFILCNQYDLQGLKELAESALIFQINDDNVIETLSLADLHNSEAVKLAAMKYIKMNKILVNSDVLDELNNVELVKEICEFLLI